MPHLENSPSLLSLQTLKKSVTLEQVAAAGMFGHLHPGTLAIKRGAKRPIAHVILEWFTEFPIPRIAVAPLSRTGRIVGPTTVIPANLVTRISPKDLYGYCIECYKKRHDNRRRDRRGLSQDDDFCPGGLGHILPLSTKTFRRELSDTISDIRGLPRRWTNRTTTDYSRAPIVPCVRDRGPTALEVYPNAEVIQVRPEDNEYPDIIGNPNDPGW